VIASLRAALIIGAGLWLCACRAASIDAQVTDSNGAPLRDAAVYLLPKSAPGRVAAAPQAVIEQKDREFIPFVTVIRTGTAVVFPNRDQTMHHVYSFSPPKNFQIKLYEGDPPDPVVFDKPGVVAVGCNIHDWMQAYILVVDTPHFAVTDAQGHALIEGLERGEYTAHVWHPHARAEWSSTVVLERGERERVSASLPTRTPPRKSKPPLDPTKY
jgi:plastocyanin